LNKIIFKDQTLSHHHILFTTTLNMVSIKKKKVISREGDEMQSPHEKEGKRFIAHTTNSSMY